MPFTLQPSLCLLYLALYWLFSMETFPLYGDSSLWRLETFPLYGDFTGTLLYGDFSSLLFMETFPLYGDSSLWRLFLFTGPLLYVETFPLYGDFTGTLWGLFSMETFPLYRGFTGTLLYGDFSSLRGLFSMETFPLYWGSMGTLLYGDFSSLDSLALCLRSQETLSVRDWALGFGLSSEAQERIQKGKLAEHRDLASRMQRQASPSNYRWVDELDEPHSILLWWRSQSSCYRGLFCWSGSMQWTARQILVDSSLWRLFLFTLYGNFSSLRGLFSMETFPLYGASSPCRDFSSLRGLYGDSTGTLLYGGFSSFGDFTGTLLYGDFASLLFM